MKKRGTISISFNQRDNALIQNAVKCLEEATDIPMISRVQAVRIALQLLLRATEGEIREVVSEAEFPTPGRPRRDGLPPLGYLYLKSLLLGKKSKPERLYRVRFDKQSIFCP